jgi:predicted secreted protein
MPAKAGRQVLLQILNGTEYETIAALTSKGLTINKEPIDITSDDDAGWRTLLEDLDGTRSVDIECQGVLRSIQVGLLAEGLGADVQLRFDVPGIRRYDGTCKVTSYSTEGETADKHTFSGSFQSSGAVTFAASA